MFRTPRPRGVQRPGRAGFTTLELLTVVAIGLILTTIALPNMLNVVAVMKLRGNIATLSGIFQNCRMMAVKANRTMTTHFDAATYGIVAFVKEDPTDLSGPAHTDTQVELAAPLVRYTTPTGTGAPAILDNTILGFTPQTGDVSFNSRGLPCAYASGACLNTGFSYYFKDTRRAVNSGWAAVSISPAGRIKRWYWSGTAWVD